MPEKTTERVMAVMRLAKQEAIRLKSLEVRPEHILVAILVEGGSVAAKVLKNLRLELKEVRYRLDDRAVPDPLCKEGWEPALSSDAAQVYEAAQRICATLEHGCIGTEHILIGLLEAGGQPFRDFLAACGIDDIESVVEMIFEVLGADVSEDSPKDLDTACVRCKGSGREPMDAATRAVFKTLSFQAQKAFGWKAEERRDALEWFARLLVRRTAESYRRGRSEAGKT